MVNVRDKYLNKYDKDDGIIAKKYVEYLELGNIPVSFLQFKMIIKYIEEIKESDNQEEPKIPPSRQPGPPP